MSSLRLRGALLLAICSACAAPYTSTRADLRRPPAPIPAGPAEAPTTQEPSAAIGFDALLMHADAHAPDLLIAESRYAASKQRIEQATEWPDPKLRLTWWAEEVQTRSGPMDARVMIGQKLPWPGKRDAAGAVAEAGSMAAATAIQAVRAELRRELSLTWNERVRLAREQRILEQHAELLREIEAIAQIEAERGGAQSAQLMRIQVDRGRVLDRVAALQESGLQRIAELESIAGRALDPTLDWETASFARHLAVPEAAAGKTIDEHPLVRLHAAHVESAHRGIEVATLAGRPDFEVALDYTFVGDAGAPGVSSGEDPVSLSLGVDLPFGSGADAARESEARAEWQARQAELRRVQLQLRSRDRIAVASQTDAERRDSLYREELLPQAEEAFAIVLDGYQARNASFGELLETARDLLRIRTDALQAELDLQAALVELNYLHGSTVPSEDPS